MTKKPKPKIMDEQFPALLTQMKRIADALERQVELMDKRLELEQEQTKKEGAQLSGQREERRKKFEAQLHKLAEVDRMARELRSKLEEKQAAEMAAKAAAEAEGGISSVPPTGEGVEQGDQNEASEKPATPPTEN